MAAGKRVRTETQIGMHPLSVTSIGLELAAKVFGDLSAKTILVLGRGRNGQPLRPSRRRRRALGTCSSPTGRARRPKPWRRRSAAASCPGRAWRKSLSRADVVVGATASPSPVVRRQDVEEAMRERRGRPMFFLDLAVPADIDPEIAGIYNTFVYAINDLEQVAEENRRRRAREMPRGRGDPGGRARPVSPVVRQPVRRPDHHGLEAPAGGDPRRRARSRCRRPTGSGSAFSPTRSLRGCSTSRCGASSPKRTRGTSSTASRRSGICSTWTENEAAPGSAGQRAVSRAGGSRRQELELLGLASRS